MKYFNGLNMGEGIAGTDAIGMSTTVMYSCIGVAIVNRTKRCGGLYHYPAKCGANANVTGTLRQMCNDIGAEEIVVTPAPRDALGQGGSDPDDVTELVAFLKGLGVTTITTADPRNSAQLTWGKGGPVFNVAPESQEPVEVPERFRSTMSSGARDVEANVWYYGGDGETDGVLEQSAAAGPTKAKKKKMCVIL